MLSFEAVSRTPLSELDANTHENGHVSHGEAGAGKKDDSHDTDEGNDATAYFVLQASQECDTPFPQHRFGYQTAFPPCFHSHHSRTPSINASLFFFAYTSAMSVECSSIQ